MLKFAPVVFAALLATAAQAGEEAGCVRMAGSQLCRESAAMLPFTVPQSDWVLPAGCTADVAEMALGDGDWLFLQGARCGDAPLRLEAGPPDPAQGGLRPVRAAGSDAVLAQVVLARPDPVAQIVAIAAAGLPRKIASACAVGPAAVAGIPDGAWIYAAADRRTPDSACGKFGASAEGDAFWLQSGRYLFFFPQGSTTGAHLFDPATFNAITLPAAKGD